ncbi:MAG TPA: class I SAM-dependent methyltransferase [Acidimicrobiales bacterium]
MRDVTEWEPEAEDWVRWARAPGHDAYWYYRTSFFDLLPSPGARTIELGCGEGRVARDLGERGHHVVGADSSRTLVRHAREADVSGSYLVADGAAVPAASGAFDLVVAYNSLQVVADMPGTVHEAARLLVQGGHLCLTVSHPAMDLGRFVPVGSEVVFAVRPGYFESRRVEDTIAMDGLTVTCRGWSYTLEDYMAAFERAGLVVEAMREPTPTAPSANFERWRSLPLFLMARLVKLR